MWFRNLQLYGLIEAHGMRLDRLEEQLARGPFNRCASNQPSSRGWWKRWAEPPATGRRTAGIPVPEGISAMQRGIPLTAIAGSVRNEINNR